MGEEYSTTTVLPAHLSLVPCRMSVVRVSDTIDGTKLVDSLKNKFGKGQFVDHHVKSLHFAFSEDKALEQVVWGRNLNFVKKP